MTDMIHQNIYADNFVLKYTTQIEKINIATHKMINVKYLVLYEDILFIVLAIVYQVGLERLPLTHEYYYETFR